MNYYRIFIIFFCYAITPSLFSLTNIAILQKYLPSNPTILEAGAHKGTDTIKLSQLWPEGKIYALEPVPTLFEELQETTRVCTNVKIYNYALASSGGTATLYVSSQEGTGSSSLLRPKDHLKVFDWISFPTQITVPTITIDELVEQENITTVDLLWLDLQGTEYSVLSASPAIMKKVSVIATEVNFCELYSGCTLYQFYKEWLNQQGFEEVFIERSHPTWGDAVFVRKRD